MKNSEIIKYIDRFCAHKEEIDLINIDLVYTILAHGYLYVKPGKTSEKFKKKERKALKVGFQDGIENSFMDGWRAYPLDEWIRVSVAKAVLKVARAAFDRDYFAEQITYLDPDEVCDESLLDKYLGLMNKKQLLDFDKAISHCSSWYFAFTTFETMVKTNDELHELCKKANPSLPETTGIEYVDFQTRNPYYMADYLSREELTDAIYRKILMNKSIAGHLARTFYYTNSVELYEQYIELISTYERTFHEDIYNPDIFYEVL